MQAETRRSTTVDAVLKEIDQEAEITQRLLDIIPEDKLTWRPHPKAKSLGELAMHIAALQGMVAALGNSAKAQAPDFPPDPSPESRAQILEVFAESIKKAKEIVGSTSEARVAGDWTLLDGDKTLITMPRADFWRSVLLNHNYHHRGQLSTYLRQLDVPLPSIYGPSADANPFA